MRSRRSINISLQWATQLGETLSSLTYFQVVGWKKLKHSIKNHLDTPTKVWNHIIRSRPNHLRSEKRTNLRELPTTCSIEPNRVQVSESNGTLILKHMFLLKAFMKLQSDSISIQLGGNCSRLGKLPLDSGSIQNPRADDTIRWSHPKYQWIIVQANRS